MGRPPKYRFVFEAVIELLCDQRLSLPMAAKKLGCSYDALRDYVRKNNIQLPRTKVNANTPAICSADPEEIQHMLNAKNTFRQIAEKFNCKESAVSEYVKRHNLQVRQHRDISDELTLRKLYCSELLTIDEIASQFGI